MSEHDDSPNHLGKKIAALQARGGQRINDPRPPERVGIERVDAGLYSHVVTVDGKRFGSPTTYNAAVVVRSWLLECGGLMAFAPRAVGPAEEETLGRRVEAAIRHAAELGDDAYDFIAGRGLFQLRLDIEQSIRSLEERVTAAEREVEEGKADRELLYNAANALRYEARLAHAYSGITTDDIMDSPAEQERKAIDRQRNIANPTYSQRGHYLLGLADRLEATARQALPSLSDGTVVESKAHDDE